MSVSWGDLNQVTNLFDELDVMLVNEDVRDLCLDFVALLDRLNHDEVAALDPHILPELGRHGNLKYNAQIEYC